MAIVNGSPGFTQFTRVNILDTLLIQGNPVTGVSAGVLDGQIVKYDATLGQFVYAGATANAQNEWTFDKSITVPQASLKISDTTALSEATGFVFTTNTVTGFKFTGPGTQITTAGSTRPNYAELSSDISTLVQPVDTSTITTNPTLFTFTPTKFSQINKLTFRAASAMTNVRITVFDLGSSMTIKYIPSKEAVNTGTGGLNFVSGSNVINMFSDAVDTPGVFNIGISPLRLFTGQSQLITIQADSVALDGNGSGEPFFAIDEQEFVFTDVALERDLYNIPNDYVLINDEYTTNTAVTGGIMVNYLPTPTADTVTNGQFTAGVAATSNPTVSTVGAATFAASDLILIVGTQQNDGLYEVLSHVSNTLTVRGVGTTAVVEDFTKTQFVTQLDSGTITKINVSLLRTDTSGVWQEGQGSVTPILFSPLEGDVDGPASSVDNRVATFNGATGKIIQDNTQITADAQTMDMSSITSGVGKYAFRDAANERGFIAYDTTQNSIVVDSKNPGNTQTLIRSDNAVVIEYGSGSGFIDLTNSSGTGSDLENIVVIQNRGTNAGAYEIHVGGRNPEGNVLAPEGAHYYRSGASPAEYIKTTGVGSATGWGEVRHTLNSNNGDVFGPASSVNQSMAIFDNTTGKLLDDAPQAIWFESGDQRAMTFYSPVAATGVIGVQLHRSTAEIRSAWEFRESTQGTDFVAAGSGTFRIAQDNTSSSANLAIENNGATAGNITLTTAAAGSGITLTAGATSGEVNLNTEGVNWKFDGDVLQTTASGAAATSRLDFKNSGGTTTGSLQNQNSGSVFTLNSTYEILLQTSSANGIHLQNDNTVGSIRNANTASPDTIANTIFSNGGTNPGSSALHVGNRNPEGNVTANGGALYVRDDPTNPDLYVKVGDATNTGWESLRNSVLTDPIATMYRPLTGSSAGQSITTGPQPILAFNTDGINTNTALLESDATTERIDVKQITDTTNGDIYRVNFNAIWRGTTGVRMTFDFVTLSAGSATTTNLEAEVVNNNASDENSVSISGVVRGPSTLSGVTGFRVQFAGNTTGSVAWDHVHMSVERIG